MGFGINKVIGTSVSVIDKIVAARDLGRDVEALLRAVYVETKKNLAIIELCCIEARDIDDNVKIEIVSELTTDSYQALFLAGRSNTRLFKKLEENVKDQPQYEAELGQERPITKNVLQSITFLTVRIQVLQRLGQLSSRKTILKHVKIRIRIKNIKTALLTVLEDLKSIKEINRWQEE
jgi:hypothetical protein